MRKFIAKHIDIEISGDFNFNKYVSVLIFKKRIAKFRIKQGSTEIERL